MICRSISTLKAFHSTLSVLSMVFNVPLQGFNWSGELINHLVPDLEQAVPEWDNKHDLSLNQDVMGDVWRCCC